MSEAQTTTPPPKRGPGRPKKEGGVDPTRAAGRHGKIWEECEARARADGQSMTDFVGAAITNELQRRRRQDARKAAAPRRPSLKAGPS